jgi:hypothetical protein
MAAAMERRIGFALAALALFAALAWLGARRRNGSPDPPARTAVRAEETRASVPLAAPPDSDDRAGAHAGEQGSSNADAGLGSAGDAVLAGGPGELAAVPEGGAVVGRVAPGLDPTSVRLDGRVGPRVAPDGSFRFEGVDAGFHLVELPDGERLSVILAADETVELGGEPRIPDVVLRLESAGRPLKGGFDGALFGLGTVASCKVVAGFEGIAPLGAVIPGEYLLWSSGGHSSVVSIRSAEVDVDVGRQRLTVRSGGGGRFALTAEAASALPEQARDWAARDVPAGGELVFAPLPAGEYVLRELGSGTERSVRLERSRVLAVP